MKLVFTKSNLNKAVGIVMKAVPTRTTMNILECILIDATTNDNGVKTITTMAIDKLIKHIIKIVPIIVAIPVNKLVKLCNNPVPIKSISLIARLIISPRGCLSKYFNGNKWIFSKTLLRKVLVILYVILLVNWPKSHCTSAVKTITIVITSNFINNAFIFTLLIPINKSIACPNKTGVNKVSKTLIVDKINIDKIS